MSVSYNEADQTVTVGGVVLHVPRNVAADEIDGILVSTMSNIHGGYETAAFRAGDLVFEHRCDSVEDAVAVHGWLVEQVRAGADPSMLTVPVECSRCHGDGEVRPGRDPQITRRCPRCHGTGEVSA
jgi:hypothetical protein